ncbi:MAG: hypothetical protein KC561_06870 [Myxococcales bacterium]|nr:hypothetical protein [Myxococcales bacterium]
MIWGGSLQRLAIRIGLAASLASGTACSSPEGTGSGTDHDVGEVADQRVLRGADQRADDEVVDQPSDVSSDPTEDSDTSSDDGQIGLDIDPPDQRSTEIEPDLGPEYVAPVSFRDPIAIATTEGNSKSPSLALLSHCDRHVVWHDFSVDPANLFYAHSVGSSWDSEPLTLDSSKAIFGQLRAQGAELELVWQSDNNGSPEVWFSRWSRGSWAPAERVGAGSRPALSLAADGTPHAVFFDGSGVSHATRVGGQWAAGDPISVDFNYLNELRLGLVSEGDDLVLALSTSPGEVSYDIRLWHWSTGQGWTGPTFLHESVGLSSDDMAGASYDGVSRWVWTEQDPTDEWTIGIARKVQGGGLQWIARPDGFSVSPQISVGPDGTEAVVFITPSETVGFAQSPYSEWSDLGGVGVIAVDLKVDRDGASHIVFAGRDTNGVQQIFYTTNSGRCQ